MNNEQSSLAHQLSVAKDRERNLWNVVDTLQSALKRARPSVHSAGVGVVTSVFSPQTEAALCASPDNGVVFDYVRVHRKLYDSEDYLIGAELSSPKESRVRVIGATEDHPDVARIEVC